MTLTDAMCLYYGPRLLFRKLTARMRSAGPSAAPTSIPDILRTESVPAAIHAFPYYSQPVNNNIRTRPVPAYTAKTTFTETPALLAQRNIMPPAASELSPLHEKKREIPSLAATLLPKTETSPRRTIHLNPQPLPSPINTTSGMTAGTTAIYHISPPAEPYREPAAMNRLRSTESTAAAAFAQTSLPQEQTPPRKAPQTNSAYHGQPVLPTQARSGFTGGFYQNDSINLISHLERYLYEAISCSAEGV